MINNNNSLTESIYNAKQKPISHSWQRLLEPSSVCWFTDPLSFIAIIFGKKQRISTSPAFCCTMWKYTILRAPFVSPNQKIVWELESEPQDVFVCSFWQRLTCQPGTITNLQGPVSCWIVQQTLAGPLRSYTHTHYINYKQSVTATVTACFYPCKQLTTCILTWKSDDVSRHMLTDIINKSRKQS